MVKSFFAWLKVTKIIAEDPAADIVPPRLQWKQPRVLAREEYRQLLEVIDEPRDRALVQLLLQTGIRLAEAHRVVDGDFYFYRLADGRLQGIVRFRG